MSAAAIELHGVQKTFRRRERGTSTPWWRRAWKDKVALEELSLAIEAGGVTGILGPNGSGKSTLIRILGTLLTPDSGRATVFGWDVVAQPRAVRMHVNRVSVEAAFFKELSPWENMLYAGCTAMARMAPARRSSTYSTDSVCHSTRSTSR